jgi:hypothetical protein
MPSGRRSHRSCATDLRPGFPPADAYIWTVTQPALTTIEQLKEDLAASAADIEAGRVVPGETVLARIQEALARYEAEQHPTIVRP